MGTQGRTSLAGDIRTAIREAKDQYYRLVLVVGPSGAGKTGILRELAGETGAPFVNVNLELAGALEGLTGEERALRAPQILDDLLPAGAPLVLLDNLEMLFYPDLRLDPMAALKRLARHRTVVAAWTGHRTGERLSYASPGHREYRTYPTGDFLAVTLT
ncbi:MAG TPA: BREX-3 system P-loop-containing protein BrxF [Chloroflexota bacterium]|nr:BREX-3 system P-loop-containing protein BrxF [Chloroflexota bacterium]